MSTIYKQRIESGDVVFNAIPENPSGALSWGIDVMEGWKSTGEPDVLSTELGPNRDGVALNDYFPVRQRFITIGGWAYAATEAQAEALADVLVRDAFPRNTSVKLTRFEANPRYATVRRSSQLETDWSAVQTGFRWSVTVVAKDPLLYGADAIDVSAGVAGQSVGGLTFTVDFPVVFTGSAGLGSDSANVVNRGTANSPSIRATLTGPLPRGSWKITNDTTGQELSYDIGVGSGETLYIDMQNQIATLNGFAISVPPDGDFLTLVPGNNVLRLYAEYDAAAGMSINAESAWE